MPRKPRVHVPGRREWHPATGLAPPASPAPLAYRRHQHSSTGLHSAISCTYGSIFQTLCENPFLNYSKKQVPSIHSRVFSLAWFSISERLCQRNQTGGGFWSVCCTCSKGQPPFAICVHANRLNWKQFAHNHRFLPPCSALLFNMPVYYCSIGRSIHFLATLKSQLTVKLSIWKRSL